MPRITISLRPLRRAARYVRENPAAPPALAFMALLTAAAAELAMGNEALANRLAEYAYYALVAAVATALVDALRGSRAGGERG